ncbi:MAG: zinc ribbon domain-containing protein, partial [Phycisphaera sp. TMED9]
MIVRMGPRFDPSPVASLPVTWANVLTGILLASGIQGLVDWSAMLLVLSAATLLHLGDVRSPRTATDDPSFVSRRGILLSAAAVAIAWVIRPECGVVAMIFAVIMILDELRGRRGLTGILAFATRRTTIYALGFAAAIPQPLDALLGTGGAEFLIACLLLTVVHIHLVGAGFVAWGRFDPTSPTCPECRHQVLEDQSTCPECGSPCGAEFRAEPVRVTQGRYRG